MQAAAPARWEDDEVALDIKAARPYPALFALPWSVPLEQWPEDQLAALPRGISRHIVRFAKVDGRIVPLDHKLRSGDHVEIQSDADADEEDAQRRDFTINSLYYSVADFTVRDYVGGMQDLEDGVIRLIGNPETRYREDPVRMLRAVRFAAKLDMKISPETAEPIPRLATLLNDIPPARLFEEALKLLQAGYGYETYKKLREYSLFQPLFPTITRYFTENGDSAMERIIAQVLKNTDNRIHNDMRVNPAFLFAAMFWYPLLEMAQKIAQESGLAYYDAFALAMNEVLDEACRSLAIPKRLTSLTRDIWQLQLRMSRRQGKRAWKLMEHPKFRAAYDLLALRAEVENNAELQRLAQWWGEFQVSAPPEQKGMLNELDEDPSPRRRHRRPRKRAPRREGTA